MVKIDIFGDFLATHPEIIQFEKDVSSLLERADFNVVNFEAPVAGVGNPIRKSGKNLNQPIASAYLLKEKGFNVFLLANNHMMDYGEDAVLKTKSAFEGCLSVGAGTAQEAYEVKIIEKEGCKIGLLSLVHKEFGVLEDKTSKGIGTAWVCSVDIKPIIEEVSSRVDYLLVFPHAGLENADIPLPEWRNLYKRFIDWGASAVIGSHPHAPQGWEEYKGFPIFYSLGNFYFDILSGGPYWNNSLMVKLYLDETLRYEVESLKFNPQEGIIDYDKSNAIAEHTRSICDILKNNTAYNVAIEQLCSVTYKDYIYGFQRGLGGTTLKVGPLKFMKLLAHMLLNHADEAYLLNAFQCETHRWTIERALKTIISKS